MKTYKVTVDDYGTICWYNEKNQLHREDGPAVEFADGSKEWFINSKRHREDGPAVEFADGYKAWYIDGKRHREDGPAVERTDGSKLWYINGKLLTEQEFIKRTEPVVELTIQDIETLIGKRVKIVKNKD